MAALGHGDLARLHAAVGRFAQEVGQLPADQGIRLTIRDYSRERGVGFDRVFAGFGATIEALPTVLAQAVPTIRDAFRANFDTEGASGREPWAPLAEVTIADRLAKGYGPGPILQREGNLRAHVLATPPEVTRRGDVVELRIAPDPVVAGTGRPYFRAQSLGSPRTRLPARPSVVVGPAAAVRITSTVSRAFRELAARQGLA